MALLAAMTAGAAEPPSLEISIAGLRSPRGNILICLTANAKAFPNCAKDAQARKMIVAAAGAAKVRFSDLVPGIYAIALIHDENGNGRMDAALFVPREGFGFSRNAVARFGPPKFAAAQFGIALGENIQAIKVKYLL